MQLLKRRISTKAKFSLSEGEGMGYLKPKTPHLVARLRLDNVSHRAIHPRQSRNLGLGPCWIQGDMKLIQSREPQF